MAIPKNIFDNNESEFLTNVSRGKLPYPPGYLFDCYTFFKARSEKKLKSCCNKIFRQTYKFIYERTSYEFENLDSISKRLSNIFFKALEKKETLRLGAKVF